MSRSFNNNNNPGGNSSNNNSINRSTSKKPYGTLPRNGGILIAVRDWSKKTPPLPTTAENPTNYYEKLLLNSTKLKQRDHQHFYENHSIIRKCKDSSSSLLSIEPIYAVVNKLNKKRSKNNASADELKVRTTTSEYATIALNNNNINNNDNEKKQQQQQQQGEIEGATIENQQNENNEFSIYAKVWKGPKKSSESKM